MQIVSQLELQLQKERERLQAMMSHLHLNKKQEEEKERMKSESQGGGGGGRENGFPRTPEPEISKPLAGLPKPLAFGPPAMHGLSFPPNLGGLGKIVSKMTSNYTVKMKLKNCNWLVTGGFPGPRPPGFSFLPPGPNQGMSGMLFLKFSPHSVSSEYFLGPKTFRSKF